MVLAIEARTELTEHETHGIAVLLRAFGTPPAVELAARLERTRNGDELALEGTETQVLLRAFAELRQDRLPEHILALESALAAEIRARDANDVASGPASSHEPLAS